MKEKLKDNVGIIIILATVVGIAFGAWFKLEDKFTPLTQHQALAGEVQKVAVNAEKLRLQNDLRWFELQYRTTCKTPAQKNSSNCQWMKSEIDRIKGELQKL